MASGQPITHYLMSVPERVLRSASALAGGLLREVSRVAVPASVRQTHLYQAIVENTFRFLIEYVGEVKGAYPSSSDVAQDFLLRRTAGNGIEWVGLLTFHASPVWVMAALADISGTGKQLIREISASLQKEGLLEPGSNFETMEQMLDGLERSAGRAAQTLNMPPLDVASLRAEWAALRNEATHIAPKRLPSMDVLWKSWRELQETAVKENRSVFEVSTVMAVSAIRWLRMSTVVAALSTGRVFAGPLLEHYAKTLRSIHRIGYFNYWLREFSPYLRAAAEQFSPKRMSFTQKILRKSER